MAIKWTLAKEKKTISEFTQALARDGINVVVRENDQGNIYGITYVDFKSKCVFNGSDLGKEYSAKGILEQLGIEHKQEAFNLSQKQSSEVKQGNTGTLQKENKSDQQQSNPYQSIERLNELELLLNPEQPNDYMPNQLLKKKKQKKQSKGLN